MNPFALFFIIYPPGAGEQTIRFEMSAALDGGAREVKKSIPFPRDFMLISTLASMKKTLFLRVFMGYVAVIALLAAAVTAFAPPLMRRHHIEEQSLALEHTALFLERSIVPFLTGSGVGDLGELVSSFGKTLKRRITVIDREGRVLADSEKSAADMDNHLFRPEIQAALRGERKVSLRESSTLKQQMLYLSIPLMSGAEVAGALRLSLPMKDLESLLVALRDDLLKIVGLVTLFALLLAFSFARAVSRPIQELAGASARVSAGEFETRVSTRRSGELGALAMSFNDMTGKLKTMFEEITLQEEEIEGLMALTPEGLCVLAEDSRVILSNAGFRRIAQNDAPEGRHVWEVVRSSGLSEIVRRVLESRTAASGEVTIQGRSFLCAAAYLASGKRLIVTLHESPGSRSGDPGEPL